MLKPGLLNLPLSAFLVAIRLTTAWKFVVHAENKIQIENILKVWRYNIIAIIIIRIMNKKTTTHIFLQSSWVSSRSVSLTPTFGRHLPTLYNIFSSGRSKGYLHLSLLSQIVLFLLFFSFLILIGVLILNPLVLERVEVVLQLGEARWSL